MGAFAPKMTMMYDDNGRLTRPWMSFWNVVEQATPGFFAPKHTPVEIDGTLQREWVSYLSEVDKLAGANSPKTQSIYNSRGYMSWPWASWFNKLESAL